MITTDSDLAIHELAGVRGTPMESEKRGWVHVADFKNCVGIQIRNEVIGLTVAEARRLSAQIDHIALRIERRAQAQKDGAE